MGFKTRRLLVGILLAGKLLAACATQQALPPRLAIPKPAIITIVSPLLQSIQDRFKRIIDDEKNIDRIFDLLRDTGDTELYLGREGWETNTIGVLFGQYLMDIEEIRQEITQLQRQPEYAVQAEILLKDVDAKKRIARFSEELYLITLNEKYNRDHRSLEWLFRFLDQVMKTALKESSNIKPLLQLKENLRQHSERLVMQTGFSSFSGFFR